MEENLRIVETVDKAFNERDWRSFDDRHAESVVVFSPLTPEPTKGLEAHRKAIQGLFAAFSDLHVTRERSFGQAEWVCAEYVFAGTHTGPLPGPGGRMIPGSGRRMALRVCALTKFEGGQIVEERLYFDRVSMMAQLGLMG